MSLTFLPRSSSVKFQVALSGLANPPAFHVGLKQACNRSCEWRPSWLVTVFSQYAMFHCDFLPQTELEQANQRFGETGESIALEYERWRLVQAGKKSLADKIEWVSKTQGDGLGFDILSRNVNGTDRYIEVASTKWTKESPFYFSTLEYHFSKRKSSNFFLYRVFNLKADPKLFIANGAYVEFCNIKPTQFKVRSKAITSNGILTFFGLTLSLVFFPTSYFRMVQVGPALSQVAT